MRNVVLGLGISLDGYIARLDGAVDFLFMPRDYSMAPFFANVDTAIMGRKTLDAGLKMSGGSLPRSNMAMYVFSKRKPPGERDGVIFVNESPATFLRELRKRPGKDIWLMGGGERGCYETRSPFASKPSNVPLPAKLLATQKSRYFSAAIRV
jgi:dihydrofolate reductase